MNGIDANDYSGWGVANGDVNGDGFTDIIIGATQAQSYAGRTYVVFGKATGWAASLNLSALDGTNGFVLNGIDTNDFSATSVSSGDVNGDGFDDVIIGAPWGAPNGQSAAGETYVVFGKASGWAASTNLSTLNGTNGFVLNGIDTNDRSGRSVSSGDVNGDGFVDVIIGAELGDPNGQSGAGETYVVFGKASGWAASTNLSTLNGTTGFVLNGVDANDSSGRSVSSGDVNGDGFTDVIITAYGGDPNGQNGAGETYVVFGKASGWGASTNLSTLNGTSGFVLNGIDANDWSGFGVSSGDVNGDSFADIIIGAYLADPNGQSAAGETYVVFGKASGWTASTNLSTLNGTTGFVLNGIGAYDRSGNSVSSGDVNNDGFADIIIGAYNVDPGGRTNAGATYVVFGKASGWAASLELSALNGTTGFVLNGIDTTDYTGASVASGDVNGDGFDDVIIGANSADPNGQAEAGETYVVFGKASGWAASTELSGLNGTTGFVLNGIDTLDQSGFSVSSGDVNGDGFDDVIIGAYNATPNGQNYAGETYVVFGKASGWAASTNLSSLNGTSGFVLNGIVDYNNSGKSISSGDVNNDGFADVIIGAPSASPNGLNAAGETYVVFGKASGWAASTNLSTLNGTNGFVLNGIDANDNSGYAGMFSSDMNNDGYADIIIGAMLADPNGQSGAGETYVVFGKETWDASQDIATIIPAAWGGTCGGGGGGGAYCSLPWGGTIGHGISATAYLASAGTPTCTSESRTCNDGTLSGTYTYQSCTPAAASCNLPWGGTITDGQSVTANLAETGSPDCTDETRTCNDGTLSGTYTYETCTPTGGGGGSCTPPETGGTTVNGIDANDQSGKTVSSGDINGDGFDDLIIGALNADPNGNSDAGETYVVFGKATGWEENLNLSALDGTNGFVLNGIDASDYSAANVSSGDVNGDGFDDVIIGAIWGSPNGQSKAGETYVVFGKASWTTSIDLSSLNGTTGFVLNGIDASDYSGYGISSGDVNGDGFDDVIIGAHYADPNGQSVAGETYVVFGKASGWAASTNLSTLNGTTGFVLNGIASNESSGQSVSSGDVNGDGFDDVIIGAPAASPNGQATAGVTYVVFGKASGWAASTNLSSLNGTTGFVLNGIDMSDNSGGGAGRTVFSNDVNADGFADIIIGAPYADPNGSSSGETYVVFGKASGWAASLNLSTLNGTTGFVLNGAAANETSGLSVSSSDVNGDGFADIIIGAYGSTTSGGSFAGRTYVVFGKTSGWAASINLSTLDGTTGFALNGIDANDYSGFAVSSGYVNDDGYADIIIGAPFADPGNIGNTGETYVVLGKETWSASQDIATVIPAAWGGTCPEGGGEPDYTGFRVDGAAGDQSGQSIATGDINGDGFDDVIIGAHAANSNFGYTYVVFGKATGITTPLGVASLDGTNGFRLDGTITNSLSGREVGSGDINGDGFDDVIVNIPWANSSKGYTYVVFGKASGWAATATLAALANGTTGVRLDGSVATSYTGEVISTGDINNDGFDDVILGAPHANSDTGYIYVLFGKASGWSSNIVMNGTNLNGTTGFRINGTVASSLTGLAISSGDINGDGYDDVIIGAPYVNSNAGYTYVVFGKAGAWSTTNNIDTLTNGTTGFRLDASSGSQFSGTAVSSGNVNNDAYDDVIVGALHALSGAGAVYVVFGKTGAWAANTLLNTLNGTNGFKLSGAASGHAAGSTLSSGDVNDDGFDDLYIGAPGAGGSLGSPLGYTYVVFGKAGAWAADNALSTLANGTTGFRLDGSTDGDGAGASLSSGDTTGDGKADVIIGATSANSYAGYTYGVYGKSGAWSATNDLETLTVGGGAFTPASITGLSAWYDATDLATITLTYSADSLSSATATGTSGTTTITTSVNVSSILKAGARIRLSAAGAVTTADVMGANTYTIASISGTTITTAQSLTTTYSAQALYRGLVSQWNDKSSSGLHMLQATASRMPMLLDNRVGFSVPSYMAVLPNNTLKTTASLTTSMVTERGSFTDAGWQVPFSMWFNPTSNANYPKLHTSYAVGSNAVPTVYYNGGFALAHSTTFNPTGLSVMQYWAGSLGTGVSADGTETTNATPVSLYTDSSSTAYLVLGDARNSSSTGFTGTISELTLYSTAVSSTDRTQLVTYHQDKFSGGL